MQTWRTTINGLEAIAEAHNDATLFLDEISEVDAREAAETAYLLGNGMGKQRMSRTIGARKKLRWRLLFVSSGELTLAEHAASASKRTRGGAEVRLLNIDADAGVGQGIFENLHGAESPDAFARDMKEAALRSYGSPFRRFLKRVVRDRGRVASFVEGVRKAFIKTCVPSEAPGEIRRAAHRFALIGAAGELATRWRLTGWQKYEAIHAAKRSFRELLATRSSPGASDADAGVRAVRAFILTHANSRFETIQQVHYSRSEIIRERAGFVRLEGREAREYYIFPETFRREVCNGHSHRAVLKELDTRGYLRRTPPDLTLKPNLPGIGRTRVYCIRASILKGD